MSALINEMVNIGAYVARWWRQISIDGSPLLSWMLALWALSVIVSAVGAFIGIGFPSVGGSIFGKVEAGRFIPPERSARSDNHWRTVMWDSIYRNASEEDKDSYFDNR